MLTPSKPDKVFLEAAPCFSSNALLLCAYGNPTIFAHPGFWTLLAGKPDSRSLAGFLTKDGGVKNGGSRKKTVSFRNALDWLGSENTGSKTAQFII